MATSQITLYDQRGRRKYLAHSERERFLKAVDFLPPERRAFCLVLLFTGCRISEAMQLTRERIDAELNTLNLKTLKRRDPEAQRIVPVSAQLIRDLQGITQGKKGLVWTFCRRTGWRIVKSAMAKAGIEGAQACPKGLRHGFGVTNAMNNVPIEKISKWMGHSNIKTTMIYLNVVGEEEREFAKRGWLGY